MKMVKERIIERKLADLWLSDPKMHLNLELLLMTYCIQWTWMRNSGIFFNRPKSLDGYSKTITSEPIYFSHGAPANSPTGNLGPFIHLVNIS